jgi:F-type H+-transporting ATPase subunit epsilon
MADALQLEVVTPERLVVKDVSDYVQLPGKSGYLGILPGHAPLLTELAVGEIKFHNQSGDHYLAVAWGFAEVLPDKVTILAETAERAAEIDVARAQAAKQKAEAALKAGGPESADAAVALQRAETRLEVAEKKK